EQREGIAGRLPAPLLLPLHQVPRRRHHEPDRRRALPRHQEATGGRSPAHLLRGARSAGPEEEALDLGTARLAQAALERTGRAPVRAAGVPQPPRSLVREFSTAPEPNVLALRFQATNEKRQGR